jgi:hypothetical protein
MARWSWVLVSLVVVFGCSSADPDEPECDLTAALRSFGGTNAKNCGFAERGEDPSSVDDCVISAFESKTPFIARYFRQGIDSQLVAGIAGDDAGSVTFLLWDSDPSGGSREPDKIYGDVCLSPSVDTSSTRDATLTLPLKCSGTSSLGEVCGS